MPPKKIPFEFVFDYLLSPEVIVKPVFGMFYIYKGNRIVLILRDSEKDAHLNGIWVASYPRHLETLRKEIPSLAPFSACGKDTLESEWQLLPAGAQDFEACAIQLCRLIVSGDKRIGRVPNEKGRKD